MHFNYSENNGTQAALVPKGSHSLWQSTPAFRKIVQMQVPCLSEETTLIPIAEATWIWLAQAGCKDAELQILEYLPMTIQRKVGRELALHF